MYLKTTSPQFLQYGTISDESTIFNVKKMTYVETFPTFLRQVDQKISIEVIEGIAVLVILGPNNKVEEFVIHRRVVLNSDVPFMIIPLTQCVLSQEAVETYNPFQETLTPTDIKINHRPIKPKFYITDIFSYYYSVKGQNYFFKGESHQYWEITYVDTGELIVEIEGQEFILNAQEMIFYAPGQFHKQRINSGKTCSYLTIMFDMNVSEEEISLLQNKSIHCNQQMYTLVSNFIKQSELFEYYDTPYSRDIMVSYLQELIILMLQCSYDESSNRIASTNPVQQKFESEMIDEIHKYILNEFHTPITVQDICSHFSVSRSTLQALFKKYLNTPPKQYINELKMKQAERIMMEENIPITEISFRLGFSSIHYFSRKFKKEYGISPSEFSQSLYKKNIKK